MHPPHPRTATPAVAGLPARASQFSRGSVNSQSGNDSNALADKRANARLRQAAMVSGSALRRLPANASFSSAAQWPRLSGNCAMRLSVRISQRKVGGRLPAGT